VPCITDGLVPKVIDGVGSTLMVKVVGVPGHPFAVGVTVNVPVITLLPLFVPAKIPMLPTPLAASPMFVLLLLQL